MSARDHYHACVRAALLRDGWEITHDPYTIPIGVDRVFVDLGAEAPIAAERRGRRIAVEIKSFRSPSDLHDLEGALGQYVFYRSLMGHHEPGRELYLAISENVYETTFRRPIAEIPVKELKVALLVFDPRSGGGRPMDSLNDYRRIIRGLIEENAKIRPSVGEVEVEAIIDEAKDHYELLYSGWDRQRRIHGHVLHLDIRGGKIWIQHDGTYHGIANDLVEAGVPKDKIVLAFKPPDIRPLTGFATS